MNGSYDFRTECGKQFSFQDVDGQTDDELRKAFPSVMMPKDCKLVKCCGFLCNDRLLENIKDFLGLRIRDDDVWICSFPRSGTTWIEEMAWCLVNNLDIEGALKAPLQHRILGMNALLDKASYNLRKMSSPDHLTSVETANAAPSPRIFFLHVPFQFLPLQLQNGETKAKIIYALRDPRDVCVSFYKLLQDLEAVSIDFSDFCDLFLEGKVPFGPYWDQVGSYLEQRNNPNLFISKYENKIENLPKSIEEIAAFLGKEISKEGVAKLSNHLSFDAMKENQMVNRELVMMDKWLSKKIPIFIREGKVGEWRKEMDELLQDKFRQKMNECFDKYNFSW